jgi:hypothetical protein
MGPGLAPGPAASGPRLSLQLESASTTLPLLRTGGPQRGRAHPQWAHWQQGPRARRQVGSPPRLGAGPASLALTLSEAGRPRASPGLSDGPIQEEPSCQCTLHLPTTDRDHDAISVTSLALPCTMKIKGSLRAQISVY